MELRQSNYEVNRMPGVSVEPPATELLLNPRAATTMWAKEIGHNPLFVAQLTGRQELSDQIDQVLHKLPHPTTSLETAIKNGQLEESQVEALYDQLSRLLEDEDYSRLALYLPFEFLPDESWKPATEELQQAIDKFKGAYMHAWQALLSVHDVRANFVDGDVLEIEQRQTGLPRVVKAAHLLPQLIQKGLITKTEARDLAENSSDSLLQAGIDEALSPLGGYEATKYADNHTAQVNFSYIRNNLDEAVQELESQTFDGLTAGRQAWLRLQMMQAKIKALGDDVCGAILEGDLTAKTVSQIVAKGDSSSSQVLILGIQKAIEIAGRHNGDLASWLLDGYQETMSKLWERDDPEINKALAQSLRRLYHLGLVDEQLLADRGVSLPVLSGTLSANLRLIPDKMDELKTRVEAIEADPELSELIYPVALVYGSRLKGYADDDGDIDLAVFVKPGTPVSKSDRLRQLLGNTFDKGVIEFWLDEEDEQLKVHDFKEFDAWQGESSWAHVLFCAAWMGKTEVVDELRKKLLPGYFYETGSQAHGRNARGLWLEEMERDTLQYRLLQKGYERHYAPAGPSAGQAKALDGQSMFWDSGYRRLATKLFIEKVFLPKLPR